LSTPPIRLDAPPHRTITEVAVCPEVVFEEAVGDGGIRFNLPLSDGWRQPLEVPPLVDIAAAEAEADPVPLQPRGGCGRADVDGKPLDMGGLSGGQDPVAGSLRRPVLGDGLVVEPLLRRRAAKA
jgi:hypothetical protein